MKPDSGKSAIPDLLLERYRLNEVSPAERAAVERRLREDDGLRRRLEEIERSDEAIRETGFPASLARRLRGRIDLEAATPVGGRAGRSRVPVALRQRLPAIGRSWRWALPLAVGAGILLLAVAGPHVGGLRPGPTGVRIKGLRPSLTVFRQTPRGSESLADGAAARQGDVVLLAYQAAGRAYGVIVSIDGRGGLSVHLPTSGRDAARLLPGDKVVLDQAYELDDAPRWECFYFVTGQEPFAVEPVVEAAKRVASLHRDSPPPSLALPHGLEQSTFFLQKEDRP